MSASRYLDIVRDARAGHISNKATIAYSGPRATCTIITPVPLAKYNIPARLFAGPVVGLSVGARRRRRPVPPAKPVVFRDTVAGTKVFRVRTPGTTADEFFAQCKAELSKCR